MLLEDKEWPHEKRERRNPGAGGGIYIVVV
jgi:hypothetical protein